MSTAAEQDSQASTVQSMSTSSSSEAALYVKGMKALALSLGTAARFQLAFSLMPVARSSVLPWLLGEGDFSSLLKYHR
jgi:hypothetical protein